MKKMGNKMLCLFILIATLVAYTNAKKWVIDWKYGGKYDEWLEKSRKEFNLGDKLVFKYKAGEHNVVQLDQIGYDNCICPVNPTIYKTGEDVINMTTIGKSWFICFVGEGKHCKEGGMRLVVDVPPPKDTSEHVVGDEEGWAPGVDYPAWTLHHIFDPQDKLIFKYEKGKHNVLQVDEAAYNDCIIPADQSKALSSGKDEVILEEIGPNWFISGIGKDCQNGMKLSVWVICPNVKPKPPALQAGRKLNP